VLKKRAVADKRIGFKTSTGCNRQFLPAGSCVSYHTVLSATGTALASAENEMPDPSGRLHVHLFPFAFLFLPFTFSAMLPDNYFIASQFSMLSKLMDIHGDNSFKSKSYSIAAFNIEKLPVQFSDLDAAEVYAQKGIGDSLGKKILEIISKGYLPALKDYVEKTPQGILEMLSIKGLGPKKIATIWKEMEIESPGELLYACNENRLARFKGFGEKTQQSIQEAIAFYQKSQGSHLYAELHIYAEQLSSLFHASFKNEKFELTGAFRRQLPVVDSLDWVTTVPVGELQQFFRQNNYGEEDISSEDASFRSPEKILLKFYSRPASVFYNILFETSCSDTFLDEWNKTAPKESAIAHSEEAIFAQRSIPFIPAFLREKPSSINSKSVSPHKIIAPDDITAIIHSHSTWSDGSNTLEEMAKACIDRNYEYLVISDHSKAAAYANGLSEERIKQQHIEIDRLNEKYAPFRIFKSIECDILGDGSLDYNNTFLATFDLIIASVHSNLKMQQEKAMSRLLAAIRNPYTTILGHMTGRLLLSRPGYPLDHKEIIDACAENKVAIEINANPRRLDMDWSWIDYALEKGVLLSIDPDAHEISEYDNCRYGVLAAQKGGLTKSANLSSFSLKAFADFLEERRKLKNL
jgi:DNA polymerase (family X)